LEKRPVYLQLPSDVAGVKIGSITKQLDLNSPYSDPRQLARAVSQISERLSRANHPAILLDADVDRFGLTEPVIALAEANDIPIAHLIPAKGVIRETHPLSIGIYRGAASSPAVRAAVEDSDCLLCFGARFTDLASGLFTHEINPASVIDLQPFSVRLEGEFFSAVVAKELLSGLLATTHRTAEPSSRPLPRPTTRTESETNGMLSQAVLWRHIQKYLKQGDVIVSDAGTSFFASANLNLPDGASFIAQPIWGSLGYALPAALGTCLAAPDRRQLVFLGDGAFQMTVQELSTILRLNLNPIIFLLNNDGYTIERLILGRESSYNDISPWQYSQVPVAFDTRNRAVVHVVRTEAELEAALHAARDIYKLHLLELVLPRTDAPEALVRFTRRVAAFDFPQMRDGNESETNADSSDEIALMYRYRK
jgi:indolepyruvate decarboxylase